MRKDEFYKGILAALGVGEDRGVPEPVWREEEYLKAIYEAIKAGGGGGQPGRGIKSIELNNDYTLTIHYTDDTEYTTPIPIRGEPGVDGISPTVTVTETATGATITITDKDGTTTADILNGVDGGADFTRIGKADFTSDFDTDKSAPIQIQQGQRVTVSFRNYSNRESNWYNFALILTSTKTGDTKKTIFRPDNWAGGSEDSSIYHLDSTQIGPPWGGDWSTFRTDMNGALVRLTVERTARTVNVAFSVLTAGGKTFSHQYLGLNTSSWGTELWMYLTVEHAYIDIYDTQIVCDTPPAAMIAPPFETNEFFDTGKVVSLMGGLYKFKAIHNATAKWDPTIVDKVYLSDMI